MGDLRIDQVCRVAPAIEYARDECHSMPRRDFTEGSEERLCGLFRFRPWFVLPNVKGFWKHDERIADVPFWVALSFLLYPLLDSLTQLRERIGWHSEVYIVKEPDLFNNC